MRQLIYSCGRAFAVLSRPVSLYTANEFLVSTSAQGLAVVFLASSLAMVFIAADPHRRYYSQHFATKPPTNGLPFYQYAVSLLLLLGLGCAIAFGIVAHFSDALFLPLCALAYFFSERLADEVQRLRIFERNLHGWGIMATLRGAGQLAVLALIVCLGGKDASAGLIVLAFTSVNLALFVPQLPGGFLGNLPRLRGRLLVWLGARSTRMLFRGWAIWVAAQLTSGFGYLDRVVALIVDTSMLPLFMLVVMCFSIVQLTVDFYYLSPHRRDFLEQRVTLGAALNNLRFLVSLGVGVLVGCVACMLVLRLARNGASLPIEYVVAIACIQTSVAVSTIPREVLYWINGLRRILIVEIVFWVLFLITALLGLYLKLSLATLLFLVLVCAAVRLGHYLALASKAEFTHAGVRTMPH